MSRLRGPAGCPWDRIQTHKTLLPYLREETKEVEKAVRKKDYKNLQSELGDVLLQVIFHAQIAKENKLFNIYDVMNDLKKKLVRRHPHVFGNKRVKTAREVILNWDRIKRRERS